MVAVSGPVASALAVGQQLPAGRRIDLTAAGQVTLVYPRGCVQDTLTGGAFTVGTVVSLDVAGGLDRRPVPCPAGIGRAGGGLSATAAAAGTGPGDAREVTTRDRRPTFAWDAGRGPAAVRVFALGDGADHVLWQGGTAAATARYPASAPALVPGAAYRVDVIVDGRTASALFTVDPGYVPDGADVVVLPR